MINLRKFCLFVVLAVLPAIGVGATAAQGKSGDFSEPEFSAEAAALAQAEDDAIAEEKARETDLDPLVIATGYVLNGKKEEAFQFLQITFANCLKNIKGRRFGKPFSY